MEATNKAETKSGRGRQKAVSVNAEVPDSFEVKQLFISSALTMSWQMAIAVLVPIVGGYYLDQYFKTTPLITLLGMVAALALVILIVRKTIAELPDYTKIKGGKS